MGGKISWDSLPPVSRGGGTGKTVTPETRFTVYPALPVDPRIGISRSAWETDD